MSYLGDFAAGDTVDFNFTTRRFSTGAPHQLAGTPAVRVYKGSSTTEDDSGITLTVDFDSRTGLNHVTIDTSADGTFYADGGQFEVVITAGTVDSVSVVGEVVGRFTLRAQASLYPTTAGRKLDVTAAGEAGIDWNNIGSPTTVVNLSGTTVKTATDVETDTADIQSRLPAALVSGRMDSNMQAAANGVITAAVIADSAIDRATFAADTGMQTVRSNTAQAGGASTITLDASASATNDIYNDHLIYLTGGTGAGQAAFITDYVGATKVATIKPAWVTAPDNTTTFAIIPAASLWHQIMADHVVSGSTGASLNAAGSAGDPWTTALPGAYGAGTAGKIIGDNLNATVSSRASQTSLDTLDDYVDSEVAAIKAKTDQLTFTTANKVDATIQAAGDFAQGAADKAWSSGTRTLTAIGSGVIAAAELNNIADALLKRDWSSVSGEAARSVLNALRKLRNEWSISGTTLTVKKEDDSTTAYTQTLTATAGADPITAVDN